MTKVFNLSIPKEESTALESDFIWPTPGITSHELEDILSSSSGKICAQGNPKLRRAARTESELEASCSSTRMIVMDF